MEISLTEEQSEWRRRAAGFSGKSRASGNSLTGDVRLIESLAGDAKRAGLLDCWLPREDGGSGADLFTSLLVIEELASHEAVLGLMFANRYLCYRALAALGDSEARRKITATLVEDQTGFEPVFFLSDNESAFVAHAETRTFLGVTPVDLALLVLDREQVKQVLEPARVLGFDESTFHWISSSASLSKTARLVRFRDNPADLLHELSARRRLLLGATMLGVARAAFEYALDYSLRRVTFGKPIHQHEAIALKLADMQIAIETSRLMLWRACNSPEIPDLAARAWTYCEEACIEAAIQAVQTLGGHGYLNDHPVGRWMCDIQMLSSMQ